MQDPNERRVIHEEVVQTPLGAESTVVEQRTHVLPTPAERSIGNLVRIQQVVWLLVGIIVSLIGLRFILLAVGANMTAGFGALLYGITQPLVAPFLPLFNEQGKALSSGAVIESGSVVAIAIYALLGWVITKVLALVMAPKTPVV